MGRRRKTVVNWPSWRCDVWGPRHLPVVNGTSPAIGIRVFVAGFARKQSKSRHLISVSEFRRYGSEIRPPNWPFDVGVVRLTTFVARFCNRGRGQRSSESDQSDRRSAARPSVPSHSIQWQRRRRASRRGFCWKRSGAMLVLRHRFAIGRLPRPAQVVEVAADYSRAPAIHRPCWPSGRPIRKPVRRNAGDPANMSSRCTDLPVTTQASKSVQGRRPDADFPS